MKRINVKCNCGAVFCKGKIRGGSGVIGGYCEWCGAKIRIEWVNGKIRINRRIW